MRLLRQIITMLIISVMVIAPFICPQFCRLKAIANIAFSSHMSEMTDISAPDHAHHTEHDGPMINEMLRMLNAVTTFFVFATAISMTLVSTWLYRAHNLYLRKMPPLQITPPPRLAFL